METLPQGHRNDFEARISIWPKDTGFDGKQAFLAQSFCAGWGESQIPVSIPFFFLIAEKGEKRNPTQGPDKGPGKTGGKPTRAVFAWGLLARQERIKNLPSFLHFSKAALCSY